MSTRPKRKVREEISSEEARRICTKTEWTIVESSFPERIEALTAARLKSKIVLARRARDKYRDLYRRQHAGSRTRRTGRPDEELNARTRRKAQLFATTLGRYETRLKRVESDRRREEQRLQKAAKKKPDTQTVKKTAKARTLNAAAAEEKTARKRQSRSAAAQKSVEPRKRGRIARSPAPRIQSHSAAANRRGQAKRDSRL